MKSVSSKLVATLCAAAALAGCGGGGSNPSAPPPPIATAEGAWNGSASDGSSVSATIFENGDYWVMYYANSVLTGVVQGSGTSVNGSFSSTDGMGFRVGGTAAAVNLSASYRERVSLQGTITPQAGGTAETFSTTYDANYDTAANLSDVSGNWHGSLPSGETFALNVAPGGSFAGAGSSGCLFTGTLTPRASGKGVYDLSITFKGGVCLLGTQTIAGIAMVEGSGSSAVMLAAALTSNRSTALGLYSMR
jgi:hypothetical protein